MGNDLLYVEGTGDQVYGGDGDDVIILNYYATAGAVIDGGAGSNIVKTYAGSGTNLSGASITNVQTLDIGANSPILLTAAQLAGFTTVSAGNDPTSQGTIVGTSAGTLI